MVFVCTHNSARSQLAAALWAHRTAAPGRVRRHASRGRVHPRRSRWPARHGLRLDPTGTAHVDDVVDPDDLVIAVCDNAHEDLTSGAARPRLHWSVPDPVRVGTDAAFEAAYTDLADRIDRLAPALAGDPSMSRP